MVVSIPSVSDRNATPFFFSPAMMSSRWDKERPSRSSFQTISLSPAWCIQGTVEPRAFAQCPRRLVCEQVRAIYTRAQQRITLKVGRFGDPCPTTRAYSR